MIAHLEGICHTYVDGAADPVMARAIVRNAKMRRVSICGAMETLLVDRKVAVNQLPAILADCLATPGVHLIDCPIDYSENDRILNKEIKELSAKL